jgi:hypothetical protein
MGRTGRYAGPGWSSFRYQIDYYWYSDRWIGRPRAPSNATPTSELGFASRHLLFCSPLGSYPRISVTCFAIGGVWGSPNDFCCFTIYYRLNPASFHLCFRDSTDLELIVQRSNIKLGYRYLALHQSLRANFLKSHYLLENCCWKLALSIALGQHVGSWVSENWRKGSCSSLLRRPQHSRRSSV